MGELEHKTKAAWPRFESGLHYSLDVRIANLPRVGYYRVLNVLTLVKHLEECLASSDQRVLTAIIIFFLFTQTLSQRVCSGQICASLGKAVDGA